jgi:branched-chain amino acid transport system permease protein
VPFSVVAQIAVSGALMGLVYALVAYGFQLTFATSKSINFGQGELVMVSAFVSLSLIGLGLPYWMVVPLGLLFGAFLGLVVERVAVRLALEQKSEGWILLSIIVGLFLFSFAENVWGRDDRPFPTPIPSTPFHVLGVDVTPLEISVLVGVLAVMGLVEVFKRRTLLGKAFEAVSADRDAGELMGISATHTVMLSAGGHPGLAHHHRRPHHGLGVDPEGLLGRSRGRAGVGLRRGHRGALPRGAGGAGQPLPG